MTAHLDRQTMDAYTRRLLVGSELLRVDDHLASCPECRELMRPQDLEEEVNAIVAQIAGPAVENKRVRSAALAATLAGAALLGAAFFFLRDRLPRQDAATRGVASPRVSKTAGGPAIRYVLQDEGRQIGLRDDGTIAGLQLGDNRWNEFLARALRDGQIPHPPRDPALSSGRETLLGPETSDDLAAVRPINEVVLETRPRFQWKSGDATARYVVQVFDEDFRLVMASPAISDTFWTSSAALERSRLYSWQVTASSSSGSQVAPRPPQPQARFRILSATDAEDIQRAREMTPVSHLLLGLVFSRKGLFNDAEKEFRMLLAENPDSPVAKRLHEHARRAASTTVP